MDTISGIREFYEFPVRDLIVSHLPIVGRDRLMKYGGYHNISTKAILVFLSPLQVILKEKFSFFAVLLNNRRNKS